MLSHICETMTQELVASAILRDPVADVQARDISIQYLSNGVWGCQATS